MRKRDKLFNNKKDDEADFCESYKSQILGAKLSEEEPSFVSTIMKLLTILILLACIIGISFYGYNYFINSQKLKEISFLPPVSLQVSDEELIVEDEEQEIVIEKNLVVEEENNSIPIVVTQEVQDVDETEIEKIANDVKIAIARSELEEENNTKLETKVLEEVKVEELNDSKEVESLEVPTSAPEAKYLEELADLSKEIDKERNK